MKVIKLDREINDSLYYIDFIPRKPIEGDSDYISITVDSTLYSADSTFLSADMTILEATMSELINVTIVNEFTNEEFNPMSKIEDINGIYKLTFLETNFLSVEGRYSILIKLNSETVYKGKMIFTDKNIEYYRYTEINNNKMYL